VNRYTSGLQSRLTEPAKGYRAGPENAVILEILSGENYHSVLDLGAGNGSLGILAGSTQAADTPVTLCERQPELAQLCEKNAALRPKPVSVMQADLRDWAPGERFDLIVANPPWYPAGFGQSSSNPVTHQCTHALHGSVHDFCGRAAALLAAEESSAFWLLFPSDRLAEAVSALAQAGLHLNAIWLCHARHTGTPFRVWLRASHVPSTCELRECSVLTAR
jgi:tRNA1Val (adenine37-N6)-methyltransferase